MRTKKKVIIVGGGFAGIRLVENLNPDFFEILLIDKLNHHQFQPLFYQVATSQLEPASISFPLRHILSRKKNVQIRMTSVDLIDYQQNRVVTPIGSFNYDYLIVATGCTTHFFGKSDIAKHVFTLKTTYDAIKIRNHIIQIFEKLISVDVGERPALPAKDIPADTYGGDSRESLLNLVIVGAGPTGVELAGAFAEIKNNILPADYPGIDFSQFNVYLIEGGPHTLGSMSKMARKASRQYLQTMGVKVLTEIMVENYDGQRLELNNGAFIPARTVIWAAGITGNLIAGLPREAVVSNNRIKVNRINQVEGLDNVFAVGDISLMKTPKYPAGHPQVANVAINQARNLARNLFRTEMNKPVKAYEYRDLGSMATIGRNKAVVDLPFLRFKGFFAWLVWMLLHLMLILSVRNKLVIFINWAWAYLFKDTSLRLILKP